jgi:hypothetical protein
LKFGPTTQPALSSKAAAMTKMRQCRMMLIEILQGRRCTFVPSIAPLLPLAPVMTAGLGPRWRSAGAGGRTTRGVAAFGAGEGRCGATCTCGLGTGLRIFGADLCGSGRGCALNAAQVNIANIRRAIPGRDVAQTSVCWVETLLDPSRREESPAQRAPLRQECLRHESGLTANSTTSGVRILISPPVQHGVPHRRGRSAAAQARREAA